MESDNVKKLKTLKAVKYKYKTPEELDLLSAEVTDTASYTLSEEITAYFEQERIGLIAQEIQEVYPELVKTDQQGLLGVDYLGLIPVLIEAIKEQQIAIEELNTEISKLKKVKDK